MTFAKGFYVVAALAGLFWLQSSAAPARDLTAASKDSDQLLDPAPIGPSQHFVRLSKATSTKMAAVQKQPVPPIINQPLPIPLPIQLPNSTPAPAASSGSALPRKPNALTSAQVQANPIALLQTFTVTDLQAALADANAQTPPDETSAQCYTALIPLVQSGIANPLPNGPGVFQLLQKARDAQALLSNLQSATGPLSKLNLACAPLVLSAENTLIQLGILTGTVVGTGGAAGGLLPFALPVLPIPPL